MPLALVIALLVWFVMAQTSFGFHVRTVGRGAARGALRRRSAGADRSGRRSQIGGGLAGLAGIFEAAGPFGQIVPQFPTGYGFTAIIVAFLGRLHPIGIVILGGAGARDDLCRRRVGADRGSGCRSAAAGVFQAMLLFFLLATDS